MKTIICELSNNTRTFNVNSYPITIAYNTTEDVKEGEIYHGLFKEQPSSNPYNYMMIIKVLDESYKYENNGILSNKIENIRFREINEFKLGLIEGSSVVNGTKM